MMAICPPFRQAEAYFGHPFGGCWAVSGFAGGMEDVATLRVVCHAGKFGGEDMAVVFDGANPKLSQAAKCAASVNLAVDQNNKGRHRSAALVLYSRSRIHQALGALASVSLHPGNDANIAHHSSIRYWRGYLLSDRAKL